MKKQLVLEEAVWYGWQMLPGYQENFDPYFSPILIQKIKPLKTGHNLLLLEFINAMYAHGVQHFSETVKVIHHQANYMVIVPRQGEAQRTAVISDIDFNWIKRFLPKLWHDVTSENRDNCQRYLHDLYFKRQQF